ncbi:MAG: cytochrome C [Gammaproteobacteria bacterium]|nr:cytochrome C [Gammaproteobacteria bacterium]
MHTFLIRLIAIIGILALSSCTNYYNPLDDYDQLEPSTILAAPPAAETDYPAEQVSRGKYLVGLLGCGSCHTDGALVGAPVPGRALAGSYTGIAYSNPMAQSRPGVLYPSNLTPDNATGIGTRSLPDLVRMIRLGVNEHGSQTIPVMPWPAYANIEPDDAQAIAVYLKSLPPVNHKVLANITPGQRSTAPFVHFGVYQSKQ